MPIQDEISFLFFKIIFILWLKEVIAKKWNIMFEEFDLLWLVWPLIISVALYMYYVPYYCVLYTLYIVLQHNTLHTAYSSPREHNIWGPLMLEECHPSPSPPQWSQEILKLFFIILRATIYKLNVSLFSL